MRYDRIIYEIANDPETKARAISYAITHGFYDPEMDELATIAEVYSRSAGLPYVQMAFPGVSIYFAPLDCKHDFSVGGATLDVKSREINHTDFDGDYYVDTYKWKGCDFILEVFKDGFAALFDTRNTPNTYEDVRATNKSSFKGNAKEMSHLTHFNWNDAYKRFRKNGKRYEELQ